MVCSLGFPVPVNLHVPFPLLLVHLDSLSLCSLFPWPIPPATQTIPPNWIQLPSIHTNIHLDFFSLAYPSHPLSSSHHLLAPSAYYLSLLWFYVPPFIFYVYLSILYPILTSIWPFCPHLFSLATCQNITHSPSNSICPFICHITWSYLITGLFHPSLSFKKTLTLSILGRCYLTTEFFQQSGFCSLGFRSCASCGILASNPYIISVTTLI